MRQRSILVFATMVSSSVAFALPAIVSPNISQDGPYQIGYAANLNVGDSVINISNDGTNGAFFGATPPTAGNICVNAYVFDPQEEEIACCSCLVTPNGLVSLLAQKDLASNPLTPVTPTSIVIKLVASFPGTSGTAAAPVANLCNPSGTGNTLDPNFSFGPGGFGLEPVNGMIAWGTTLEPASTPGTYSPVNVPFLNAANFPANGPGVAVLFTPGTFEEISALMQVCQFIQTDGTGFGICKSCQLGALSGAKH